MRRRVREMEEENQKLSELQSQVEKDMNAAGGPPSTANKEDVDNRSVYVGNVLRIVIDRDISYNLPLG